MSRYRSTKGASRVRREAMSGEMDDMKQLLPISTSVKRRLSQLQLMSLVTAYVTKSSRLALDGVDEDDDRSCELQNRYNFEQALHGFILAVTPEGRLLYISENVSEYIGYTTVDLLTHNESIFDITDRRDHAVLRTVLDGSSTDYVSIGCRFTVSRSLRRRAGCHRYKEMQVRCHFVMNHSLGPICTAVCTTPSDVISSSSNLRITSSALPLRRYDTMTFTSVHRTDMKYTDIETNGESHFGYSRQEMIGKSWYEMLHPDDVAKAKQKHTELVTSDTKDARGDLSVRVQTRYGHYIVLRMDIRMRTTKHKTQQQQQQQQSHGTQVTDGAIVVVVNRVFDESESRGVVQSAGDFVETEVDSDNESCETEATEPLQFSDQNVDEDDDDQSGHSPAKIPRLSSDPAPRDDNAQLLSLRAHLSRASAAGGGPANDGRFRQRFPVLAGMVLASPVQPETPLSIDRFFAGGNSTRDGSVSSSGAHSPAGSVTAGVCDGLPDDAAGCAFGPRSFPTPEYSSFGAVDDGSSVSFCSSRGDNLPVSPVASEPQQMVPDFLVAADGDGIATFGGWDATIVADAKAVDSPRMPTESPPPPQQQQQQQLPELDLTVVESVLTGIDNVAMMQLISELNAAASGTAVGTGPSPVAAPPTSVCGVAAGGQLSDAFSGGVRPAFGGDGIGSGDAGGTIKGCGDAARFQARSAGSGNNIKELCMLYQHIVSCAVAEILKQQKMPSSTLQPQSSIRHEQTSSYLSYCAPESLTSQLTSLSNQALSFDDMMEDRDYFTKDELAYLL